MDQIVRWSLHSYTTFSLLLHFLHLPCSNSDVMLKVHREEDFCHLFLSRHNKETERKQVGLLVGTQNIKQTIKQKDARQEWFREEKETSEIYGQQHVKRQSECSAIQSPNTVAPLCCLSTNRFRFSCVPSHQRNGFNEILLLINKPGHGTPAVRGTARDAYTDRRIERRRVNGAECTD